MSNLSLARIMYGVNQESYLPASLPASALSPAFANLSPAPIAQSSIGANRSSSENFLHRAWLSFSKRK